MNRAAFFAALRSGALFGKSLTQPQVEGTEAIIDAAARHGVTNVRHVANILAQVYHETGGYMLPIKETVYASHTNKNPSDATVIQRLDNAFAKGQLTWVKTPYWRDGWFGRGPIQITHKVNYERMGKRLGVDLVANRDLALRNDIGADIAVVGMSEGLFTGKKLADFNFPSALDAAPTSNPRRIVNGIDGQDVRIAGYHRAFVSALQAGGFGSVPVPVPEPILIEEEPLPPPVGHNGGPVLTDGLTPIEQMNKPVQGAKWNLASGGIGAAFVVLASSAGWLPAAWTNDPDAMLALGIVVPWLAGLVGNAVGSYRAPDKRFQN